jgi:hypothetical protein
VLLTASGQTRSGAETFTRSWQEFSAGAATSAGGSTSPLARSFSTAFSLYYVHSRFKKSKSILGHSCVTLTEPAETVWRRGGRRKPGPHQGKNPNPDQKPTLVAKHRRTTHNRIIFFCSQIVFLLLRGWRTERATKAYLS